MFENSMIGGQLGGRLFRQRGTGCCRPTCGSSRWRTSSSSTAQHVRTDPLLRVSRPRRSRCGTGRCSTASTVSTRTQEFVWGGEVRAEAAYELTRDISLRFGMVFIDLGQGIGRGNEINDNNEDVQIAGLTFGFTINR